MFFNVYIRAFLIFIKLSVLKVRIKLIPVTSFIEKTVLGEYRETEIVDDVAETFVFLVESKQYVARSGKRQSGFTRSLKKLTIPIWIVQCEGKPFPSFGMSANPVEAVRAIVTFQEKLVQELQVYEQST
jgi:hypothetical protein